MKYLKERLLFSQKNKKILILREFNMSKKNIGQEILPLKSDSFGITGSFHLKKTPKLLIMICSNNRKSY